MSGPRLGSGTRDSTTAAARRPGRCYRLRLQLDTARAQLDLGGKLVGGVHAPPPLPGTACRKDQPLNGAIEETATRHGAE